MTQVPSNDQLTCPACGAQLDSDAALCARCGRNIGPSVAAVAETQPRPSDDRRAIDRPWFVLGLLFCATAVLGLPILWKSRGFSPVAKVLISLLVVIYTVILLWGLWLLMAWCAARISAALA